MALGVACLNREVRSPVRYLDRGLESGLRRRGDLVQISRGPARKDAPGPDLGRSVPARVDGGAARPGSGRGRWPTGRMAGPGLCKGAVRRVALVDVAVEEELAVGRELGEMRLSAPADEHPAVAEQLGAAHRA